MPTTKKGTEWRWVVPTREVLADEKRLKDYYKNTLPFDAADEEIDSFANLSASEPNA